MENHESIRFLCFNISSKQYERLKFCASFFIVSAAALLLKTLASPNFLSPLQSLSCSDACIKHIAIYKLSFASAVFHAFLACYSGFIQKFASTPEDNSKVNIAWWIKAFLLLVLCVGFFFIPHKFFYPFPIAALVFSVIYLSFQMFILVNFTHDMAEKCLEKYEVTRSILWKIILISVTLTLFLLMLSLLTTIYIFFNDCWINPLVISLLFCLNIIQVFVSVHSKVQERLPTSGLLQASVVALYSIYLMATAIHADPSLCFDSISITSSSAGSWTESSRLVSMALSIFALVYTALDTATGIEHLKFSQSYFHFIFMLASFHMAITFTDWNFDSSKEGLFLLEAPHLPYWTKFGTSLGIVLLYIWTLLLLPNRDFF